MTVCGSMCVAVCVWVCCILNLQYFGSFDVLRLRVATCDASSAAFRPLPKSMQHFEIKFWAFYAIMHAIAVECGDCCLCELPVQRGAASADAGVARICVLRFHLISFAAIQICSCLSIFFSSVSSLFFLPLDDH